MNAAPKTLHALQPLVFSATEAHQTSVIQYDETGAVTLTHPALQASVGADSVQIPLEKQFPLAFATLADLGKALSSSANSPMLEGKSLRDEYDAEFQSYLTALQSAQDAGEVEPDYGSYVYDVVTGNLFLVAPERWHRTALVTSTGMLLTDKKKELNWHQVRTLLERKVVGFIGASVGGNLIEGVMRELRPKCAKVADPDWIETNNLNRLERGSIEYLAKSRAGR